MIRVGVIGYGYWGPNIVRNLHGLDSTRVEMVCDMSPKALARVRKSYPSVATCSDPAEILTSPTIDAVAVITPVWTHYDLAIMDHVLKGDPEAVVATGDRHLNGVEDVAFMTIYYPGNVIAHINVNWLSPVKIRMTMIGGQKKMLVWNDLVADEKIRLYDKGVEITEGDGIRDLLVSYRTGDMWAPQVQQLEALHVELDYFADCIMNNKTPFNDGHAGLRIVRMLEAADVSIQKRGEVVRL